MDWNHLWIDGVDTGSTLFFVQFHLLLIGLIQPFEDTKLEWMVEVAEALVGSRLDGFDRVWAGWIGLD